jgi:carboxyl-terminal processing protease
VSLENNQQNNLEQGDYFLRRRVIPLLVSMSLIVGVFLGLFANSVFSFVSSAILTNNSSTSEVNTPQINSNTADDYIDLDYLSSILDTLKSTYLYEIPEDLTYSSIKGLIASLDDPYTSFLDPSEATSYLQGVSGEFEGIGVVLGSNNDQVFIETVLEGRPADMSGVESGDIIIGVDDKLIAGMTPGEAAQLIRGPKDTMVKLNLFRLDQEVSVEVVRKTIDIESILWKKSGEDTAIIDIFQFTDDTAFKFNENWDKVVEDIIADNKITKVILDLRNNPGGYVFSVKYVLEEFMKDRTILFKEKEKNKPELEIIDNRKGRFEDMELVVLVNQGSASASEIFASSVQDNNRGAVIGMQTVGKGVEQQMLKQNDGSILLVVFQQWLTPNSRSIDKENPIVPDFEISDNPDTLEDEVINKALDLLV